MEGLRYGKMGSVEDPNASHIALEDLCRHTRIRGPGFEGAKVKHYATSLESLNPFEITRSGDLEPKKRF